MLSNEDAYEEVCLRWGPWGFARWNSCGRGLRRYTVGYLIPGGAPDGDTQDCLYFTGNSWEEALADFDTPVLIIPDPWFNSEAAIQWRGAIRELLMKEPELDHGRFSEIDQEWLEEIRGDGYTPQDVILGLVAMHGGGL